jgi:HPt (histidine-containing phosphotransfer) domain-containing protein
MLDPQETGKPDMGRLSRQRHDAHHVDAGAQLVFDRRRFEANTMHDGALQREILGLFLAQLSQMRARLAEGAVSVEDSKFLGHTLRGAAAAVGALEFENMGTEWENLAASGVDLTQLINTAEVRFRQAIASYNI